MLWIKFLLLSTGYSQIKKVFFGSVFQQNFCFMKNTFGFFSCLYFLAIRLNSLNLLQYNNFLVESAQSLFFSTGNLQLKF